MNPDYRTMYPDDWWPHDPQFPAGSLPPPKAEVHSLTEFDDMGETLHHRTGPQEPKGGA